MKIRECQSLCFFPRYLNSTGGNCEKLHICLISLDDQLQFFQKNWLNFAQDDPNQNLCKRRIEHRPKILLWETFLTLETLRYRNCQEVQNFCVFS